MLVLLVLLATITPFVVVSPLYDAVVLPKLVTAATFVGVGLLWSAGLLARDRWPSGRWPATLWAPVVAFVVVNLLAHYFALDWRRSLMGEHLRYQGLATMLLYVLLFGLAAVAVRTTRDLRWVLLGLFTGALGVAIYALIQRAGLDWVEWSSADLGRPAATLGQPNAFGAYLLAAISASVFLALTARARWQRVSLGLGLLVMLAALVFTLSRAAYVASFVALVVWSIAAVLWFRFLRRDERPRPLQLAAVTGAGVVVAVLVVVLASLLFVGVPQGRTALGEAAARVEAAGEFESDAVGGRLSLWRMAARMTADRPLLGYGQDAFAIRFGEYRDGPDYAGIGTSNVAPESAHNFFLDLASGTGLLGLIAFLALIVAVLWHAVRRAFVSDDFALRVALVALNSAVLGYLVALFFGFSEAMTSWVLWLLLGSTAGLLARVPPGSGPGRSGLPESDSLASGMGAVAVTLIGVIALGWAATLIAADLAAGQAERAAGRGRPVTTARLAGRAVSLNPLQRQYLVLEGQARDEVARRLIDREAALERAESTYESLVSRFEPTAYDLLSLARARTELAWWDGTSADETFGLLEDALALDPYNAPLRLWVADHYESLGFDDKALEHRLVVLCWALPCD